MKALRNATAALALTLLLMVAGHADAGDPGPPDANLYEKAKGDALDAYIAGRLITAYGLSEHLSPFAIGVAVRDAKVVLTGAVQNKVQRDLALEIARGIAQARAVDSKIIVDPKAVRDESAARQGFTLRFSDAAVTARVKTRLLWNGSTRGLAMDVDTEQRVVTLAGSVDSTVESALAEQIALNTQGVTRVNNHLQVAPDRDAQLRALSGN